MIGTGISLDFFHMRFTDILGECKFDKLSSVWKLLFDRRLLSGRIPFNVRDLEDLTSGEFLVYLDMLDVFLVFTHLGFLF